MADTVYKLTPLTDKDEISASPCSVDELLAAAAAGYDPTTVVAEKADAALKKITEKLKRFNEAQTASYQIRKRDLNQPYGQKPVAVEPKITTEINDNIQKEIYNMAGFNFGGMSRFERQMREKQAEIEAKQKAEEEAKKAAEEWIWVEGYKGTDANMTCRDYRFAMHEQFDIQEGVDIVDCESGFHFCRDLEDVFSYYKIGDGHRFFRVRALVRKADYENYGKPYETSHYPKMVFYIPPFGNRNKLAAKSIQFLYELTPDEVFSTFDKGADVHTWDTEKKALAMKHSLNYVRSIDRINELVALGYSEAFAEYIVLNTTKFDKAKAVGSQTDLSMDMKVLYILKG